MDDRPIEVPIIPTDLSPEGREVWSRMVSGQPYWDMHPELERKRVEVRRLFEAYNRTDFEDAVRRRALLERMLGSVGDDVVVEPNFRCDLGCNITLGAGSFVNYDCVMFDAAPITIGDGAGSVVTRDVPDNVVAVGNPARVLRPITDADRMGFAR